MFAKKSRKRRVGRPLGFERLETREVLAGNLLATFNAGVLTIIEDPLTANTNNNILVARTPGGLVQLTDAQLFASTTTINGSTLFQSPPGVQQVTINMGGGDDTIEMTNLTPPPPGLIAPFPTFSSGGQPGITSALQTSTQVNLRATLTINLARGTMTRSSTPWSLVPLRLTARRDRTISACKERRPTVSWFLILPTQLRLRLLFIT